MFTLLFLFACSGADKDPIDSGPLDSGTPDDSAAPVDLGPGTESVEVSFDVDLFSLYDSPTLPSFDTAGGQRVLTGMTLTFEHTAEIALSLENGSPFDVVEGDFVYDFYFNTLAQLGETPEDEQDDDSGPPFLGPGSFWIQASEALAADDGARGSGPDFWSQDVSETVTFVAEYTPEETPRYLAAMTDAGEVLIVVGGFTEQFVNWDASVGDDGLLWADLESIRYFGTITAEYSYAPAP